MRVMFVDDEPQVLRGITRMLDCAEIDWEIETATSGGNALEKLGEQPVDVIVSDMKMPGMDGAQLLDEVSKHFPETVRIVLSGQANKEAVYRAVSSMHQYLAKPCEAETLRQTITRACSLRQLIETTKTHRILGQVKNLPSLPQIYTDVVKEIESENGSIATVSDLIARDPAMTAKILQLANSAIFGFRAKISSPAQAASMIGMDAIKSLVLSLSVFQSFPAKDLSGFSIETMTNHSLEVGSLCRHIALCEGLPPDESEEAFTAGLLHDVGKLILATYAPDEFRSALKESQTRNIPLVEAEREIFGLAHDGIGGYLLSLWGSPQSIVEGVALHHSPDILETNTLTIPAIVFIADRLCGVCHDAGEDPMRFHGFLRELGLEDRIPLWTDIAAEGKE